MICSPRSCGEPRPRAVLAAAEGPLRVRPHVSDSPSGSCVWYRVPRPTVERAATGPGRRTAPLLEEQRNAGSHALVSDVAHPDLGERLWLPAGLGFVDQ